MKSGLRDSLRRELGKAPSRIAWKSICWQYIIEPRQKRYFEAAKASGKMDALQLRKLIVSALGDAAANHRTPGSKSTSYARIRHRIRETIDPLCPAYERVDTAKAINVGGIFTSWDPASRIDD